VVQLLSPRGLRLAIAVSMAFPVAATVAAADGDRTAKVLASAGLAAAELDAPRQRLVVRGADRRTAEVLFDDALAGIYIEGAREVRVLLATPPASGNETELPPPAGVGLGASSFASAGSLREFLAETVRDVAGAEGGRRPFIVKAPAALVAPAGLRLLSASAEGTSVAAQAIVLSEGFESDPWARWQRSDSSGGAYTWTTTTCDRHSGTNAADAIRGGTTGTGLTAARSTPTRCRRGSSTASASRSRGSGRRGWTPTSR